MKEIPQINPAAVIEMTASARQMLAAYEKDLKEITYELENLGQKKSGLAALIEYIERADKRKSVLKACFSLADAYASSSLIDQEELADYRSFMSSLESRIASYERLKHENEEAINFLNRDLKLLNDISVVRFGHRFRYFSIPTRGWSFARFVPWGHSPQDAIRPMSHLLFAPPTRRDW
ncbi:hypothetical protein E0E54_16205 [Azotobacter chroococcum]|uniref:hypothetical protein n=1 Tax=Azotobacter chroococcum TaxID=353 RepID=UPI00103C2FA0|nr:hypothetical protein [Azotobacter chroococcum]TBW33671.1 hypothetical protein E0E54_16205 [Azotobacter chroococcum]